MMKEKSKFSVTFKDESIVKLAKLVFNRVNVDHRMLYISLGP